MAPEPVTFWCSPKDVRHQESVPCSAGFFKLFYPKWNGDMRISASIPLPGHPAVSELGILRDAKWYRGGCTMVLWAVLVLSTTFLFIKTTKKRQKDLLIMWNNLYNGAFEIFWVFFFLVGRVLNENKTALLEFWISYWETVFDFILFTGQNEKNQTYTLTDGVILFPLTEPPPFFLTGSAEPAISWLGFCNSIFLQAWKIPVLWFLVTGWLLVWIARCC